MKLRLDQDLEDLRAAVDGQAARTVGPLAAGVDRAQGFSQELWDAVREIGLTRLPFAEEYGGDGGTVRAYVVATREIARHCPVAALYPGTSIQVAMTLLKHGTAAQVERYVPGLVAGTSMASWAFTEPATGSDPRQISTRAEPDGPGWRLSGTKQFISFAGQADVALVFARTSETALGAFLVDTTDPGWQTGPPSEVLSMGGTEARPVTLDGIRLAEDALVGAIDGGFDVMIAGEAFGKVRAATISAGIAARALEEASAYALTREHRGAPIGRKFPTIQAMLGRAAASTLAAESLVLTCADLLDRGLAVTAEAASARLVAGRAARESAEAALHVCGAYGLTREMVVERLYREAVFFDVSQGVSEIQQIIVGRELLAGTTRQGASS
ncbi:acyl-CoA dehydrogenase family protein [Nocardia sp. CA-120079]|uniref:acyl-CoA dehydrogenase family protein n=1 Tax=Nocardia sp. CA-120079 TaxID=3239974 RepID=UPI003D98C768